MADISVVLWALCTRTALLFPWLYLKLFVVQFSYFTDRGHFNPLFASQATHLSLPFCFAFKGNMMSFTVNEGVTLHGFISKILSFTSPVWFNDFSVYSLHTCIYISFIICMLRVFVCVFSDRSVYLYYRTIVIFRVRREYPTGCFLKTPGTSPTLLSTLNTFRTLKSGGNSIVNEKQAEPELVAVNSRPPGLSISREWFHH